MKIELESPLSVRPARYEGTPWIKVVICVVMEIRVKIEPEYPLSVRPARYEGAIRLR